MIEGMDALQTAQGTRRRPAHRTLVTAGLGVAMCALAVGGCVNVGSTSGTTPGTSSSGPPPAASEPALLGSVGGGTAPCVSATNPAQLCGGRPVAPSLAGSANLSSAPPAVGTPVRSTPARPAAIRVTPVPRAAPTSAPTLSPTRSDTSPVIVTTADNRTTMHLVVGQEFLLDLGSNMDWTVTVADQRIVDRVIGSLVVQGAQGLYAARAPGTTVLSAVGSPPCASGGACPLFRLGFRLTIVVA